MVDICIDGSFDYKYLVNRTHLAFVGCFYDLWLHFGVFLLFFVIFVVLGYLWGLPAAIIAPMEVPSVIFGGFGGHLGCHLETLGRLLDLFGLLLRHMLGCLFHALFMGCF